MDNPFQSPQSVDVALDASLDGEHLVRIHRIAKRQRMMLFAILTYLGGSIAAVAISTADPRAIPMAPICFAVLAAIAFSLVAIIRLAMALYGPVIGVLCGVPMFMPCIGLLALLVINQQATQELRRAGVRVGFMGADMTQFAPERQP